MKDKNTKKLKSLKRLSPSPLIYGQGKTKAIGLLI